MPFEEYKKEREDEMKKVLAMILALSMVFALSACGGSKQEASAKPETPSTSGESSTTAPAAQEQAPVTIQMTYPPSANATTDLEMQWVRDKVLEATDGKVTFELYPGSSLATDKVALDSIMTGTLDSAGVTLNSLAQTIPELNTRCLPFSFNDIDHYWRVMRSEEYHEKMNETFANYGIVYLGNSGNALRGLATTKEIHVPADGAGMKMRIMDGTIYQDMYSLWGFGTSTISFGEVYTAVQQGVVDGCDADLNAMEFMAFGEVCPFYLETMQVIHGICHIVSKDAWDQVTPENQEKIMDIFRQMEDGVSYDIWEDYYDKSMAKMDEWGVKVSTLTPEETEIWKSASQPIYDKYKDVIGEDYYNWYMDLLAKYAN